MKKAFCLGRVRRSDNTVITTLVIDGANLDFAAVMRRFNVTDIPVDMSELLEVWPASFAVIDDICQDLAEGAPGEAEAFAVKDVARQLSPVPRPGKVMCAAANYSAHVAEMAKTGFTGPSNAPKNAPVKPDRPYHFLKATSCATGPTDDIVLPSAEHRIDWEVELAAVIGEPAKNATIGNALSHVAGYVMVNDVSCRAATWREDRPNVRSDWLAGKSYDTFLPIGPYFLPAQYVADYRDLRLQLWVNGEVHQDGYARDMIFSLEQQIAYLSAMLTLESGDLIATGTPAGVGQGKGAYLSPGDIVEAEISGMGRQKNHVRL